MIGKLVGWLRRRPETAPIPDALWQRLLTTLPFLGALGETEQIRLRALTEAFLAEKEFTTAGGLQLGDEICLSIAAQGCLPILELGLDYYRGWVGIVVYPDEFVIPRSVEDEFGVVHEYQELASGEAWEGGPLLISWRDAQMAGSGYNVVIHEFAHKLDMLNGDVDGVPLMQSREQYEVWKEVTEQEYRRLVRQTERGRPTLIDPYGATSLIEFFAVVTECFFEEADDLREEHPRIYEVFRLYYGQDPASRTESMN